MKIAVFVLVVAAVVASSEGFLDKLFGALGQHLAQTKASETEDVSVELDSIYKSTGNYAGHGTRQVPNGNMNKKHMGGGHGRGRFGSGMGGARKPNRGGGNMQEMNDGSGMLWGLLGQLQSMLSSDSHSPTHQDDGGSYDDAFWEEVHEQANKWVTLFSGLGMQGMDKKVTDVMGGAWNQMDDMSKKTMTKLHNKLQAVFELAKKEDRPFLHHFKTFLKEFDGYDEMTLPDLRDELTNFTMAEFEDDVDTVNETLQWYLRELSDDKSLAKKMLSIMKLFKQKCIPASKYAMMHTNMEASLWEVGRLMKQRYDMLKVHMGCEAAKLRMVKLTEKMMAISGIFDRKPDDGRQGGPSTDVCICV